MSLPGTSRRCMRAAGAAVNYIARIAGITSIIRIKINARASDVLSRGATEGSAEPSPDHRKKATGVTPSTCARRCSVTAVGFRCPASRSLTYER
jgi:hypothetical protein